MKNYIKKNTKRIQNNKFKVSNEFSTLFSSPGLSHFPDSDVIGGRRREGDHGHGPPQHPGDDPDRHGGQGGSARSARTHHLAGDNMIRPLTIQDLQV